MIRLITPTENIDFELLEPGVWYNHGKLIFLDSGVCWQIVANPYYGTKDHGDDVMGNYTNNLTVEEVV